MQGEWKHARFSWVCDYYVRYVVFMHPSHWNPPMTQIGLGSFDLVLYVFWMWKPRGTLHMFPKNKFIGSVKVRHMVEWHPHNTSKWSLDWTVLWDIAQHEHVSTFQSDRPTTTSNYTQNNYNKSEPGDWFMNYYHNTMKALIPWWCKINYQVNKTSELGSQHLSLNFPMH